MTKRNLYYYPQPQSSYTREEAIQIITRFVVRKLEKILERAIILLIIPTIIILCRGMQIAKEADKVLESIPETYSFAETLSVEEVIWNYLDSLEVSQQILLEAQSITENVQIVNNLEKEQTVEYVPSDEERDFAYRLAFGEAGVESELGQILVINVAVNNMREQGYSNLIEEFTKKSRYSSVIDGEVYNCGKIVSVEDVPQKVKDAVDLAFEYDYSEEMLKQQAQKLGITNSKYWEGGALYFYNPEYCSDYQNSIRENVKVKFRCDSHIFYRYWDK